MDQEVWNSLQGTLADRDRLQAEIAERQAALDQRKAEIQQLAATLQHELAQFSQTEDVPTA